MVGSPFAAACSARISLDSVAAETRSSVPIVAIFGADTAGHLNWSHCKAVKAQALCLETSMALELRGFRGQAGLPAAVGVLALPTVPRRFDPRTTLRAKQLPAAQHKRPTLIPPGTANHDPPSNGFYCATAVFIPAGRVRLLGKADSQAHVFHPRGAKAILRLLPSSHDAAIESAKNGTGCRGSRQRPR